MGWKILLPQEIMSEGRKLLEDAGHTVIDGRGFETEDVLADFKEYQPDAMIVRITPITREVIESNPNLKVIVRHGAGFDALRRKRPATTTMSRLSTHRSQTAPPLQRQLCYSS